MNRKLTLTLFVALATGLPTLAAADASNQSEIDLQRLIGGRVEASEAHAVQQRDREAGRPTLRLSATARGGERLDLGDPRQDRFQGLQIWND